MAHDEEAYGRVAEPGAYEIDITPDPQLVELDEPWTPPSERRPTTSWPSWLPPGALSLSAGVIALVALLGNGIGSSYAYVLKFSLSGVSDKATAAPAHTALNLQLVLAGLAILLGLAAVLGSRALEDSTRWVRDVAVAAVIVGVVAAGVHWTLEQSLDNYKPPPDVVFNSS
jgi:hypothetical protein